MKAKTETKEPMRDKLILTLLQTLIFGALLAVFGYWLDLRQEAYRQELAEQTEKTKMLLESLEPHIQLRQAAYLELQKAARNLKDLLENYYYLAPDSARPNTPRDQLELLEYKLQLTGGFGRTSTFVTQSEGAAAVQDLIVLREQYEDVFSSNIKAAVDGFLVGVISDMRDEAEESNENEAFHSSARLRLQEEFERLNRQIEQALGYEHFPVK